MGLDKMDYVYISGQTPIDEDEKQDLKISAITMDDLNNAEELNIIEGMKWAFKKRNFQNSNIFSEKFLKRLHKEMFGHIWKWAGEYRKSNKNVGVDKTRVQQDLLLLFDDVKYWIENNQYSINELAVVFHHRLVKIHLFPNGNGRHARLCADLIIMKFGGDKLKWSSLDLRSENNVREVYIKALKKADFTDYGDLFKFANS